MVELSSALGLEGYCRPTSCVKRVMCISCQSHMDVHKGRRCVTWAEVKVLIFLWTS